MLRRTQINLALTLTILAGGCATNYVRANLGQRQVELPRPAMPERLLENVRLDGGRSIQHLNKHDKHDKHQKHDDDDLAKHHKHDKHDKHDKHQKHAKHDKSEVDIIGQAIQMVTNLALQLDGQADTITYLELAVGDLKAMGLYPSSPLAADQTVISIEALATVPEHHFVQQTMEWGVVKNITYSRLMVMVNPANGETLATGLLK